MELIHIIPGGLASGTVGRHTAPDLILHDQHPEFFELFSQLLDVVADQPVFDVHIGPVVEQAQAALDVDFKGGGNMVGFLFLLLKKSVVQVLQQRHILRPRVVEIAVVDLVDAAVDDRFLYRLQTFLAAHHQLAQGEDEVGLQGDGVILLRIVGVDIHGVDILGAGRADLNNLAVEPANQGRVLCLGIADDDVIICNQEGVGNLTLGAEGFAGTGGAQNQAIGVLELLPVHHDEVLGQGVQTIIEGLFTALEQLLGGERDEDGGGTGGQATLNLNLVLGQGQAGHEALLLLIVQPAEIAVVLLGDARCLEDVGFQFLLGAARVQDQERDQEHTLVLALQLL